VKAFAPLFPSAHLATIAANFWPRHLEEWRFPVEARLFRTEGDVRILVHTQRPRDEPVRGDVVLVHGLEGSSHSGYMLSMAQALLEAGYAVHRTNIRSCGGTEFLCDTLYHAGLTVDLFAYLLDLDRQRRTPAYLVGFSLGGNQVLKLAGELGDDGRRLLAGVCAVSTPIDLRECCLSLNEPRNLIYSRWYTHHMVGRLKRRKQVLGDRIPWNGTDRLRSVYEIDDKVTGPAFGFRNADHYYQTQSAQNFLAGIRVPALLIQAKDDPMIPFRVFEQPAVTANPRVQLLATGAGGHLGFVARTTPMLWLDGAVTEWLNRISGNK
jgi:hypothetical protein